MKTLVHKKMSLLLAAALVFTAGCAVKEGSDNTSVPAAAVDSKKITLMLHFKSGTLDPHNDFTPLRAGVTETLVKLDDQLQLKGWLAETWVAKDELTWEFTIRDHITFHDGTKLDAAAVKASFERGLKVSKRLAGLKIKSMDANGQLFTVVTSEPNPALPSELVNPYASVVSVEAEKKMGTEAFNMAPVGTGPFVVKQFTPNIEAKLERYDAYWNGKAKLKEAVVKFNEDGNVRALALQSKEADIAWSLPAESIEVVRKEKELTVESIPSLRVHFLLYNQQKPQMQDVKVRQAISLLLNRESVAKDIMLGNATAANGPFNDKLPFASSAPVPKLDQEKAVSLLKEAGYTLTADHKLVKDGTQLTLELVTYNARPELPLMAQLLQSDAAKAGIKVNIRNVEDSDNYLKENKDWDVATYSNLTAPRGDGGFFLNSAFMPSGSLNPGKINIPELTQVIESLNKQSDVTQRNKLIQEAVSIVDKEAVHSYAVFPNLIIGVNKRVTDWTPGREEFYILTPTMDVK
ncbi:nickel ABC transporter substrate-binding protein [Paenibacillus turpanensis]|uniref:nickel ABC transporter substrate-binding protein n=1 Tax=Paenibacillus turpanensis TaxID=2689078 RepID=UPI0014095B18|nr:nickel ABC transporter substrate-binding protein [Paenibacillus turpanensis]